MPASVSVKNEGWDITERQLQRLQFMLNNDISKKLFEVGIEIVNLVKFLVSVSYPPSSSPFNPPHLRTGQLQESLDILDYDEFSITVGSELDYSFYLEHGTEKMQPRPHLIPTALEVWKNFPQFLIDYFDKEVTRLG